MTEGRPPRGDDLLWWALSTALPAGRSNVGTDRAIRVLVALALHADVDGIAWPSAQTLADRLPGLHRRDVRNALDALEGAGHISRVAGPDRRRSVTWRLNAPNLAGIPAIPAPANVAGISATHVAGNVAGHPAGHLARIPATNRTEPNYPKGERQVQQQDGGNRGRTRENAQPARTCTRHEHWQHDQPCRACAADRQAAEQHDADLDAAWKRALTDAPPRLAALTAFERSQVDQAVRGFGLDALPSRLQPALDEARRERELLTA
ncbi:helix-turn-helix domain-containing protein [Microbacterium caowuchunii]|uniref:Helix-turn-helix domain-containing protein n=1 Tax=Microbacterium caowuchunii TaxID=2614638 RepID=A0A5N0TMM5_9MICO|nr:helix-turn-helix domain-containing protein [Microbacterium caowuchunii]KAA9135741.1 helix-turn-helix domain-containing protein [Microbacterium caowuchunii]